MDAKPLAIPVKPKMANRTARAAAERIQVIMGLVFWFTFNYPIHRPRRLLTQGKEGFI
jgi:hypothetical protein